MLKSGIMHTILAPTKVGACSLDYYTVSAIDSMRSAWNGGLFYCPQGTFVRLRMNGELVMSDTRMEAMTNYAVVNKSIGNVLIAGMGIGFILIPILKKPDVVRVTVVEKHADVIEAIGPQLQAYPRRNGQNSRSSIETFSTGNRQ